MMTVKKTSNFFRVSSYISPSTLVSRLSSLVTRLSSLVSRLSTLDFHRAANSAFCPQHSSSPLTFDLSPQSSVTRLSTLDFHRAANSALCILHSALFKCLCLLTLFLCMRQPRCLCLSACSWRQQFSDYFVFFAYLIYFRNQNKSRAAQ